MPSLIAVLTLLALSGTASAADPEAGAQRYAQLCASCHGIAGQGDGPAARRMRPRPRDLGDLEWQASVDDAYLRQIIRDGGIAVGRSPMMMPFGQSLDDAQLEDLIAFLRSLPQTR